MSVLTRADLTVIEGDARISDRRLSEALGFNRPNDLQRLLRSHKEELADFGEVLCFEAKNPSPKGGRPIVTYMLNEHQAVALAMWAETAQARNARRQIIDVFVAWRRGDALGLAALRQRSDPFTVNAARVGRVAEHLSQLPAIQTDTQRLTHLPIWSNGRRPSWWHHVELRDFLTATHRQMTMKMALEEAARRYGPSTVPSMSSLHRYWLRLDEVFGPARNTNSKTQGVVR